MSDLLTELVQSLPLTLGLVSIALVITLLLLAYRLARAAEAASDTLDEDASRLESADEDGEAALVDFRRPNHLAPIRRSFTKVLQRLRQLHPGRKSRYQAPWFLALGATGSGTTTLLHYTRQVLPLGKPDAYSDTAPIGLNWWIFDQNVVLDVEGDLVLQATGTNSDQPNWRGLLRLLRRRRYRRPCDGVLLAIPASELLSFQAADPETQEALAARASVLRRKLWQAQEILGMQLPVYLVITKTDLVPGFSDFVDLLSSADTGQIFGWSSPDPPETAYNAGSVDTAWQSIETSLTRQLLRHAAVAPEEHVGNRDLVAFPAALRQLVEPLRIYMNQIFSPGAAKESFPFRGLYFCGGHALGEETAGRPDSPHSTPSASGWTHLPLGQLPRNAHWRVDFVADLMGDKMLYEYKLARPTPHAARSARRWSWTLRTLLIIGLLVGPLALWGGTHLSGVRAEILDEELLSPILSTLRPVEPPPSALTAEQLKERAELTLHAADEVSDYHLQTVLLPWGGKADRDLHHVMSTVYRSAVFPTARQSLDLQIAEAAKPRVLAEPVQIWDIDDVPTFQLLQAQTARLAELELDVARYNCFTTSGCAFDDVNELAVFRELINSLFGRQLQFPSQTAREFYSGLLDGIEVAPYSAQAHQPILEQRVLESSDAMYQQLFTDNVLTRDLNQLAGQIDPLVLRPPAAYEIHATYQRLLDTLNQTQDDLKRPEVAWAGSHDLELGTSFNAWLRAVIASDLLGRSTASEIRRRGDTTFAAFRKGLADASTAIGPLLASNDDEAQLEFSPQSLQLGNDLRLLLGTRFMQPPAQLELKVDPPPGKALFWRSQPLIAAVAMVQEHQTFQEKTLPSFGALEPSTALAAQRSLEENVLDQVALAQDFRELPALFTRDLRRSYLAGQVANLQSVSEDLGTLLSALETPPAAAMAGDCAGYCASRASTPWCLLSAILESHQRNLLDALDVLLQDEALYTPRDDDFAWWDGNPNLSLQAFGVTSEDALHTYLAVQQARIQTLADQFAVPILTQPKTQDCWGFSSLPPHRRFQVVLADLSDVKNKIPNNAVAQLEGFVTETLPKTTLDNCLATIEAQPSCFARSTPVALQAEPPCDYFLSQRHELERRVAQRCRVLTVDAARQGWEQIQSAFVDRLLDKFPFTEQPSQPLKQEATPADVQNFFRVFDLHRAMVEGYLRIAEEAAEGTGPVPSPAIWQPQQVQAMQTFMQRMGTVRALMAPFLEDRAKSPGAVPVFDLQVQFRVNRDQEEEGNQIFDWDLAVNGLQIAPGDIDPPGRWTFSEPVQLTLSWAADAASLPQSPRQANARLVGQDIIWEYRNGWSLFSLLGEHKAPPGDFIDFVDADPETLVFKIPARQRPPAKDRPDKVVRTTRRATVDDGVKVAPATEGGAAVPAPPPPPSPPADFTTKVFLRLTLMNPDGSKAELAFPTFPGAVPAFPQPVSP